MIPAPIPFLQELKRDGQGLIPAIVQDAGTGEVLMMAWMDDAAIMKTLETGETYFYSRSRQSSWHKGGTSGHIQRVKSIHVDCDADVLLIKAEQVGGACHEGYRSCFFRQLNVNGELETTTSPVFEPESVYRHGSH